MAAADNINWSNETILRFLKCYGEERVIWDWRDKNHKLKHKVREGWKRISAKMGLSVNEMKNKKKSLMATFRPLMKKKIASIREGAEGEDVFQPIWFAFDLMESYLGPIYDYDPEETMNNTTESCYEIQESETTMSPASTSLSDEMHLQCANAITFHSELPPTTHTIHHEQPPPPPPTHGSDYKSDPTTKSGINRKRPGKHFDEEVGDGSGTSNQGLGKKKKLDEDECDLYCKLLVRKLRRYPQGMRDRIMYKIDGLLLDNPPPEFVEQRSSSSCSNYSSQSTPPTTETRPPCIKKEPEEVLGNTYESFTYLL